MGFIKLENGRKNWEALLVENGWDGMGVRISILKNRQVPVIITMVEIVMTVTDIQLQV